MIDVTPRALGSRYDDPAEAAPADYLAALNKQEERYAPRDAGCAPEPARDFHRRFQFLGNSVVDLDWRSKKHDTEVWMDERNAE